MIYQQIHEKWKEGEPQQTIAIDFDGVIHDHKNPIPGRIMGAPIAGAKEYLTLLTKKHGYRIVIYTLRGATSDGRRQVNEWLNFYQIPFSEITNVKPVRVKVYIDDKAIRFEEWGEEIINKINLIK